MGGVSSSIATGAHLEQQLNFSWLLENVNIVLKNPALIDSQKFVFYSKAGGTGTVEQLKFKWCVYLEAVNGGQSFRIFYTLKEITPEPTNPLDIQGLYSQMSLSIRDGYWTYLFGSESGPTNVCDLNGIWAFDKFFHLMNHANSLDHKRWSIYLKFNLYSTQRQADQLGVGVLPSLERFEGSATAKARKDLEALLKNPVGGDVKIISGDGKEFSVSKGILACRSPYFEAMLRADMAESKDGLIPLPTVTGKTLEILLNFIMTGELLPGWKEPEVIFELTNAAAEYQLPDLLEFLNMSLGKVCQLENVIQLFTLANKLGMKTAEQELLNFIRDKGVCSVENFLQVINSTQVAGVMKPISDLDCLESGRNTVYAWCNLGLK